MGFVQCAAASFLCTRAQKAGGGNLCGTKLPLPKGNAKNLGHLRGSFGAREAMFMYPQLMVSIHLAGQFWLKRFRGSRLEVRRILSAGACALPSVTATEKGTVDLMARRGLCFMKTARYTESYVNATRSRFDQQCHDHPSSYLRTHRTRAER